MTVNLGTVFRDDKRFYRLLLVVGGAIAILKGLRLPYIWAATQAQIDYRFGYTRRGLFGEVCRWLHIPIWRYGVFSVVSFFILALLFLVLTQSVRRSGLDAIESGIFSALLASSYCITMLTNLVGFTDILLALLVLAVAWIDDPRRQAIAALAAGVIGVLLHDLYAVAFLPVSLAGTVCRLGEDDGKQEKLWIGTTAAMAAVVPWGMVLLLGHALMTGAEIVRLAAAIHARVNFSFDDGILWAIFGRSTGENLRRMVGFMPAGTFWVEEAFGMLAFLPTTCFFLAAAWRMASSRRHFVRWYLLLCTFAPLALTLVAYDRYRWLAMTELNAILCAIVMCRANNISRRDVAQPIFGGAWRRAAILLIAVNLATDFGLFQGPARNFPFQSYWIHYKAAKEAHSSVWQPPPN